ncbi:hypothetical protein [Paenibacillus periandrae]|uniref:hypothetical protein n=1 Tax=Paenibacillus periandrae TaxID=1761741 RepID=UPI001F0923D9|nr:hypothetical protein [Paenibacillus periandrae]
MQKRICCSKIMNLEVIRDDVDPEDLIFSFYCSVCEEGYAVGWEELCGDRIIIEEDALIRLRRQNNN